MGAQWKQAGREASAQKKGQMVAKLTREIMVAAKMGGPDPDMNPRLYVAVEKAKKASVYKDTIERAIKKGSGQLDEKINYETVVYEGFAPHKVPIVVECLTDNRNRTAPEIRKVFDTWGGKLGATNCVAWMFERKGLFLIPAAKTNEDKLMEATLDAGADDIKLEGEHFHVTCPPDAFQAVGDALTAAKIEPESKQLTRIPANVIEIAEVNTARSVLKLMEALDDHDDVQNVVANFTIPESAMNAIAAG